MTWAYSSGGMNERGIGCGSAPQRGGTPGARMGGAVCVLSSFCPSIETTAFEHVEVEPARRSWAPVEVVKPGPEGRSPRLVRALAEAVRAFLFEPMRGDGVARACRRCGGPAGGAAR